MITFRITNSAVACVLLAASCGYSIAAAQTGSTDGSWPFYGADAGNTKYSSLDLINRDNVAELEIAWRWKTENFGPKPDNNFRATPIMVDGVLYTTAGSRRVAVAIDAATGETLWMYRPEESDEAGGARSSSGRGLAYWSDGNGDDRIVYVTRSFKLVCLNAKTGLPCADFGTSGLVDLKEGLGRRVRRGISSTSPPIIVNDVIVVGSSMPITLTTLKTPPGHIRGYDPKTGNQLWIFHTIPQENEFGVDTWEDGSWKYSGNTGVWTMLTADEELGYVYLPVETPPNDYYGGHRLGDNLFAESLVCLDAKTGQRIWHYQTVHHGIFDYDLPAPPMLCDINVDGREIRAVAQVTKQGFVFVFDRVTGEPVWPIEERDVPQSTIPGERASPTQPFPTKPAPFERQGIDETDLIDFTPGLYAEALAILERYEYGPLFTPPSLLGEEKLGTLQLPGSIGGANWQGGCVDLETGVLYVTSATLPQVIAMTEPDPSRSQFRYTRAGEMKITGPQGLPLTKPPWARITAIDLNSGDHLWMTPNGDAPDYIKNHPALKGVTLPKTGHGGRGGAMVTKTLLFVGEGSGLYNSFAGAGGPMLRAYDKQTGEIVAELQLPAKQTGVPMTYALDDKQYIVIAVGAKDYPAELVALAFPEPEEEEEKK